MSSRDFLLEIDLVSGFSRFSENISLFPIVVEVRANENGIQFIEQRKVSKVAGIVLDDISGIIQTYGISSLLSEQEEDIFILKFSDFFKSIKMPHRITEIYHEVDWDKEVLSFDWEIT